MRLFLSARVSKLRSAVVRMGDGDDDRPLLRDSKLTPEQIEILNKAFDRALRALHLVDRGDPICEMVMYSHSNFRR